MTTTTHPKLNRIIALRDQAKHASTGAAEAEAFLAKAREMCVKYGIDQAILDEAPKQTVRRDYIDGSAPQEKRFPCRFGCGVWVTHTIDELNACAEKARNAKGGNAYAGASYGTQQRDPFEDIFRNWSSRRSSNAGGSASSSSTYTGSDGRTHEHKARTTGSHAYCDHEATKSARAKCRRERGY